MTLLSFFFFFLTKKKEKRRYLYVKLREMEKEILLPGDGLTFPELGKVATVNYTVQKNSDFLFFYFRFTPIDGPIHGLYFSFSTFRFLFA